MNDGEGYDLPEEQYKAFETELQTAAAAWFSKKGHAVREGMDYCLSEPYLWHHNIILPEVVRLIHRTSQTWKARNPGLDGCLHGFLYHGLSSQAMGFNLLGPLVVRKDLGPLKDAFTAIGGKWPLSSPYSHFEYFNRRVFGERHGVPTCLDFALTNRNTGLFIEVTLAEPGFDGCSFHKDGLCDGKNPCAFGKIAECPLTLKGRTYWERMEKFGLGEAALIDGDTCPFVNHYQFFQELMFALASGGVFTLLYDERSPVFIRRDCDGNLVGGLCKRLSEVLPKHVWSRVAALSVQGVVLAIEATGRHKDWIGSFKEKYGIK